MLNGIGYSTATCIYRAGGAIWSGSLEEALITYITATVMAAIVVPPALDPILEM